MCFWGKTDLGLYNIVNALLKKRQEWKKGWWIYSINKPVKKKERMVSAGCGFIIMLLRYSEKHWISHKFAKWVMSTCSNTSWESPFQLVYSLLWDYPRLMDQIKSCATLFCQQDNAMKTDPVC